MAPDSLSERIAVLEYQVKALQGSEEDFRTFKEAMIQQIADLKNSISLLTWKVSFISGGILILGNQLLPWAFHKIFS